MKTPTDPRIGTLVTSMSQVIALLNKAAATQGQILLAIQNLQKGETEIMLDLTALTTAVSSEKTVEDSAVALLNGLTAQIKTLIAASGNTVDPAALQAIVDSINANKTSLAAAVTANTPAAPPAP